MKFFKTSPLILFLFSVTLLFCQNPFSNKENSSDHLTVEFINSSASQFTITTIELLDMGRYDSQSSISSDSWSDNILTGFNGIAPGQSANLILDIPAGNYSKYRLGVKDESGKTVVLHQQQGYGDDQMLGTITHWGSDERTVEVTVVRDQINGLIVISGYSDFAGIED